ncbi:MAG TPA: hypothetical protein VG939_18815 [Caulobacteraceae bacterium]|nr:hypothetical protein [Caulobacteraceae bacterium]
MSAQVHFELFVRRQPQSPWKLDMASESRQQVMDTAEALLAERRVAAVRVTKETFDEESGEFRSSTLMTKGEIADAKPKKVIENRDPLCVSPSDLYTRHARDRIGRLLEGWLHRYRATPWELLHRPDLAERLDAAGNDLQHAVQKIAVPEAQARGVGVHELIRAFQTLAQRTIDRIIKDKRRGALPDLEKEHFGALVRKLAETSDRAYLLGCAVAGAMATSKTWDGKVAVLLDLAEQAPADDPARALAFHVLEQPLSEILESKAGLADLLGAELDLGSRLAAMTRLAAHETVELLIQAEPTVAKIMPPLEGPAVRLAEWLEKPPFASARIAIAKRVLAELNGPRRLRPTNPVEEIELLRALAMALTATSGQMLPIDDVQEAFANRSKMLVTGEFVDAYLGQNASPREEAEALIRLVENVIGGANKRQAARWLAAAIGALKFEKDMRYGPDSPAVRLAALAQLQKSLARAGLSGEELATMRAKLGELGDGVEADAKICQALLGAKAPVSHRLTMLLRMASGDAAPAGPAADRAKLAVLKLLKSDEARAELAQTPELLGKVKSLLSAGGMAA